MQVAARLIREDYHTRRKEIPSKTAPGNKARTDLRVTHGKTSIFLRPTTWSEFTASYAKFPNESRPLVFY